jgi:hypothetical protein
VGDGNCAQAIEEIGVAGGVRWQKVREYLLAVEKIGSCWVGAEPKIGGIEEVQRRDDDPSFLRASRAGWGQNVTRHVTTSGNALSRVYCNAIRIGAQKIEEKELKILKDQRSRFRR